MSDDLMERIEGCIANAEHGDEWGTLIDVRDRIEALKAENERLREALKMMVEHFATPAAERSQESWWRTKRQVAQIARAALGEKQ